MSRLHTKSHHSFETPWGVQNLCSTKAETTAHIIVIAPPMTPDQKSKGLVAAFYLVCTFHSWQRVPFESEARLRVEWDADTDRQPEKLFDQIYSLTRFTGFADPPCCL